MHYANYLAVLFVFFCSSGIEARAKSSSPKTLIDSVQILPGSIKYDFKFDQDSINFYSPHQVISARTVHWLLLVNFHTDMPLNITSTYKPGKRTLAWALPYFVSSTIFHPGQIHTNFALPTNWTNDSYRKQVTFILIPPGKKIVFKIGYAAPQKQYTDAREGGGIQIRLKGVPKDTITVTVPIQYSPKTKKSQPKEYKQIDLHQTFNIAAKSLEKYQNFTKRI